MVSTTPAKRSFTLCRDLPGPLVSVLAAHELTHALEDQHFDLDSRISDALDNDDSSFAIGAIHEGSATLVMTVFAGRSMRNGKLDMAELQAMAQDESERAAALRETPPILTRGLLGAYILGANFLARGNVAAVAASGIPAEDLGKVFAAGPVSSEQILHPEKFWDPAQQDLPLEVSLGKVGKRFGKGWRFVEDGDIRRIEPRNPDWTRTPVGPRPLPPSTRWYGATPPSPDGVEIAGSCGPTAKAGRWFCSLRVGTVKKTQRNSMMLWPIDRSTPP